MRVQDDHAVGRVFRQADHLGLQVVAHALLEAEARLVVAGARARQYLAARHVEVARDGHEVDCHLALLHAVGLLVGGQAPLYGARLGGGVHARGAVDVLDGHVADLGGLLRRHALHPLGQFVETVAPVLNEVVVVEVFGDDDVEHGHAERRVGAGAQLQMDVGARGQPGHARIDDNQARAAAHGVHDRMSEKAVRVGLERRLAPDHEHLGLVIALVIPAPGQRTSVVPLGVGRAADVGDGGQARRVAGVAGLRVAEVRGAEAHGAVRGEGAALAPGAGKDHDGLAPILAGDAVVLAFDDVEGLVPGNLLPGIGVASFLRITLHRVQQARRIVDVVFERDASRAQAALGHRVVLVALDADELAIAVHVELQPATHRMASRRRPGARARDGQAVFLVAPRLADVVVIRQGVEFHDLSSLIERIFTHSVLLSFLALSFPSTKGRPAPVKTPRERTRARRPVCPLSQAPTGCPVFRSRRWPVAGSVSQFVSGS